MQDQRILIFEPFCLDVGNERLWRVQEALHPVSYTHLTLPTIYSV